MTGLEPVSSNPIPMEQIKIFSGKKAISRIVTADSIKGLEGCLKPYRSIYAVIDGNVARKCPATGQLTEILKNRNAKIKLIETSEEGKTLETVMDICAWLLEKERTGMRWCWRSVEA